MYLHCKIDKGKAKGYKKHHEWVELNGDSNYLRWWRESNSSIVIFIIRWKRKREKNEIAKE